MALWCLLARGGIESGWIFLSTGPPDGHRSGVRWILRDRCGDHVLLVCRLCETTLSIGCRNRRSHRLAIRTPRWQSAGIERGHRTTGGRPRVLWHWRLGWPHDRCAAPSVRHVRFSSPGALLCGHLLLGRRGSSRSVRSLCWGRVRSDGIPCSRSLSSGGLRLRGNIFDLDCSPLGVPRGLGLVGLLVVRDVPRVVGESTHGRNGTVVGFRRFSDRRTARQRWFFLFF